MQSQVESYINDKNRWLTGQVDVEFPTPQSIDGRDLYLKKQQTKEYVCNEWADLLKPQPWLHEVILVDFHRLTIMFSVLQATQWADDVEAEKLIIEFLTQIILSDEYQLYIGIVDSKPVTALIGKQDTENNVTLFSDIVIAPEFQREKESSDVISDMLRYLIEQEKTTEKVIYSI
ncbi:hypothetical protein [Vibrio rumoiensis]|uniref:Flavodoxin n=1 Tax=Vibrio rumoiensis 1S-45 TaxID=1188252 RepID=A0A1E5DZP7_9VIBR|nr:hypothetical protein [Vibrio rumoiensis]OEF23485.1 hypothetical protein A1QC_11855 [Vibrio rumoiensis 1S-45]